jgi:hypothetical protein
VEQQGNYYRNKVATWRVASISKILDRNIFKQPLRPVISIFEFLTNRNTVTVKENVPFETIHLHACTSIKL